MLNKLKEILGLDLTVDYKELHKKGAVIVDVRSKGEYARGNIKGSQNIPLQEIESRLEKITNKDQPVITCCASGMRSASAKNQLKTMGYTQVYNGGGWNSLQRKLN